MNRCFFVIAAVAAVLSFSNCTFTAKSTPPAKAGVSSLVFLYTSDARGQVRSCNCSKFRYGGYGRQMTLLKALRRENRDVILVEGGDTAGGSGFQSDLKADVAARALNACGYAAMTPGDEDLGIGGQRFIEHFKNRSYALICANLKSTAKVKFVPYKIVTTRGGLRVCLIGLFSPSLQDKFKQEATGAVGDPMKTLASLVPKITSKSDFVAVIYHGSPDEAGKLASVKGIDLILASHQAVRDVVFPKSGENIVSAPVDKRGAVTFVSGKTHGNWSVGRLDLKLSPKKEITDSRHTLLYLDRSYAEDAAMVKVFTEYNANVKNAVVLQSTEFRKSAEKLLVQRGFNLTEMRKRLRKTSYMTAETCKACHSGIYESWSKTRHATAMATLAKTSQDYDPECVECHNTGARVRNGFVNRDDTPQLMGVQCEACHTPGAEHAKAPAKGFGKTDEQTCRACHTDERTPDFDFDTARTKIAH